MALILSPTVAELLRELTGGRDVEAFIVDLIAEKLDPHVGLRITLGLVRII